MDTYGGETFSNWRNPQVIPFLFAPNNGLFTYNLPIIVILAGLVPMILKRKENGFLILVTFLLLVYASATWRVWSFDCGYSARNMVEYYALLGVPPGYVIRHTNKGVERKLLFLFAALCCLYNLKMIYSYGAAGLEMVTGTRASTSIG